MATIDTIKKINDVPGLIGPKESHRSVGAYCQENEEIVKDFITLSSKKQKQSEKDFKEFKKQTEES